MAHGSCLGQADTTAHPLSLSGERWTESLNRLRDSINDACGFRDGVPRVNLGPCGRFAKSFYEQWNARLSPKVTIAFVMSQDGSECHHVVIKLPDGRFFDGGNGVLPEQELTKLWSGSHIEEMKTFDLKLLDKRSYGLKRGYPVCPNYSDQTTAKLIAKCLADLAKDSGENGGK
jgi:hypothetical protein